jgi:hypothetical protein
MKCQPIQKLFAIYSELSTHDARKIMMDQHMASCSRCANKWMMWDQTMSLVRASDYSDQVYSSSDRISQNVMERIYQVESWRTPVPQRTYVLSHRWQTRLSILFSVAMVLCIITFISSIMMESPMKLEQVSMDIFALHSPQEHEMVVFEKSTDGKELLSAVAGVSQSFIEPLQFQPVPLHTSPSFLFVISLLGLIISSLFLNWYIRIKEE